MRSADAAGDSGGPQQGLSASAWPGAGVSAERSLQAGLSSGVGGRLSQSPETLPRSAGVSRRAEIQFALILGKRAERRLVVRPDRREGRWH